MTRRPPSSPLFPYTTLFRSGRARRSGGDPALGHRQQRGALARAAQEAVRGPGGRMADRKSTRLNSSHVEISYAVFCLKKKKGLTFPVTIALLTYVVRVHRRT